MLFLEGWQEAFKVARNSYSPDIFLSTNRHKAQTLMKGFFKTATYTAHQHCQNQICLCFQANVIKLKGQCTPSESACGISLRSTKYKHSPPLRAGLSDQVGAVWHVWELNSKAYLVLAHILDGSLGQWWEANSLANFETCMDKKSWVDFLNESRCSCTLQNSLQVTSSMNTS